MKNSLLVSKNSSFRPSDIGDLLVTKNELYDLFFDGDATPLQEAIQKKQIRPIRTSLVDQEQFVLREIVPIIKSIPKNLFFFNRHALCHSIIYGPNEQPNLS